MEIFNCFGLIILIGQLTLTDLHGFEELFPEHFAGMDGLPVCRDANHDASLVINGCFYIIGASLTPHETYSILFIDADTVLAFSPPG